VVVDPRAQLKFRDRGRNDNAKLPDGKEYHRKKQDATIRRFYQRIRGCILTSISRGEREKPDKSPAFEYRSNRGGRGAGRSPLPG